MKNFRIEFRRKNLKSYLCKINNKYRLKQIIYTRKFTGVFLLALFVLCNTPTKYLHAIFANHSDFISKTLTESSHPQINAPGIDCHCQSNVIIAPYTLQPGIVIKAPVLFFSGYFISPVQKFSFSQHDSFGLRGPPSIS